RRHFRTAGPYLATVAALLIFAPHLWWMTHHDFITLRYVFERSDSGEHTLASHLLNPPGFLFSQLGAVLPILVLAWPLTGRWKLRPLGPEQRLQRDFLLAV